MTRFWQARPAPEGADPLRLLALGDPSGRSLFLEPDGTVAAGLGEAEVLQADGPDRFGELARLAKSCFADLEPVDTRAVAGEPVLVGGFAFSGDWQPDAASPWRSFPPTRLVLPTISLVVEAGRSWLVAVCPPGFDRAGARSWLDRELDRTSAALASDRAVAGPLPVRRPATSADSSDYERRVGQAIEAIEAGRLTKVTVARQEVWATDQRVEPVALLVSLRSRFPGCSLFCVEPTGGAAFVGASPERLLTVRCGVVEADALAGTAPRAADAVDDARLARELASDDKERREHRVVVDHLVATLQPFVSSLHRPSEPLLLRLANVQHLHTPLRGRLLNGAGALDLVGQVHPTPAVCGLPRHTALGWLDRREALDRGWYAGGVGVVREGGDGAFCVAIRSALLTDHATWLFAGAGIVAGSVAEREGAEVEHKLRGMREVLFRVGA
jgi:isochorismate synthase